MGRLAGPWHKEGVESDASGAGFTATAAPGTEVADGPVASWPRCDGPRVMRTKPSGVFSGTLLEVKDCCHSHVLYGCIPP